MHRLLCVAFSLAFHLPIATAADGDDLSLIRDRFIARTLAEIPTDDRVDDLLTQQQADGSWPDIPYQNRDRALWKPREHLRRMIRLGAAWRRSKADDERTRLAPALDRAAAAWITRAPKSDNYWQLAMGAPMDICDILFLAGDTIGAKHRSELLRQSRHGMKRGKWYYHGPPTGQNLVWLAGIHLERACIENDLSEARRGRDGIFSVIEVTLEEGIQQDGSFHQHGPQLYMAGYGQAFTRHLATYAAILRETGLALDDARADILVRLVLDGQRWMSWDRSWDPAAMGRTLARPGAVQAVTVMSQACRDLAAIGHPRADELAALAERFATGSTDDPVTGTRAFWRSDMLVHRRPSGYAAVKAVSNRCVGNESGNGENILGHHLVDGVTCFMRDGEEYVDTFPLWDWHRVPGTTAAPDAPELPELGWPDWRHSKTFAHTPWGGGVSTGTAGLHTFVHDRDGVLARKTWVFAGDAVTGLIRIERNTGGRPLETTLDQCRRRGPVLTIDADGTRQRKTGTWQLQGPVAVLHDGRAWLIPAGQTARLDFGPKTASWQRISTRRSPEPVSGEIFCLSLVHGPCTEPVTASWQMLMNATTDTLTRERKRAAVTVLANTAACQALRTETDDAVFAACYAPGTIGSTDLAVDRPCALITEPTDARLFVASPSHATGRITITLGNTERTATLPHSPERRGATLRLALKAAKQPAEHAISDTVAHPAPWYTTIIGPHAIHHDGTTYMAYHGADPDYYDPYVLAYDHASGTTTGPFKVGDNPLAETDPPDSHGNPAINIDGAGHLHVVYGGHGDYRGHQRHVVSVAPGDPSRWRQLDNIDPETTYPTLLHLGGQRMFLAYRAGGHRADWKYVESADNGATFGDETVLFKAGTRRRDKRYYHKVYFDSWYPLFLQGADNSLHFVTRYHACADDWRPHNHHLHRRQHLYYVRRDAEGGWHNLAGEVIPLPITREVADARCRILTSRKVEHEWQWETNDVQAASIGADGRIHLVLGIGMGFVRHIETRRYELLIIDPDKQTMTRHRLPDEGVLDSSRLGAFFNILDDGRYRIIGGKDALFSADQGATWTVKRNILPVAVQRITTVRNAHPDARFLAVGQRDTSERSANQLYLWGDGGMVTGR